MGAEGRAKGMQAQLRASKTREEEWRMQCTKAEEDARDKVLGAYDVAAAQLPAEAQQNATTASSKEEDLTVLVGSLHKENGELQAKIGHLTADNQRRDRIWEQSMKDHNVWEQKMHLWCEETKQNALTEERAKVRTEQDARERKVRRQCGEEKQRAVAAERECCRVRWESLERSLRGQLAVKVRSQNNKELQKLRRKAGTGHKQHSKIQKSQVKWEFNRAVSHAVEVERSSF